ncbi:hypothetical protein KAR91_29845 [Candidatus Pacearchaeota archaeon]|nr:hypothetical protein [Candidatus Pacearchaeota archaeon]
MKAQESNKNETANRQSKFQRWVILLASLCGKLKCLIGFHKWAFSYYVSRRGTAIGYKCLRCEEWSKDTIQKAR